MPHNLYLHASICQNRRITPSNDVKEDVLPEPGKGSIEKVDVIDSSDDLEPLMPAAIASSPKVDRQATSLTLRYAILDTVIALTTAFVVNATILTVGASAFYGRDGKEIKEIQDAYQALSDYVGVGAAT
jgi:Mn2+/Fe2+ NRAMP family transporter